GAAPEGLPAQDVRAALAASLAPMGVVVSVKPLAASAPAAPAREDEPGEPFVYTLRGPDRLGLIASITGVMAAHGVNIVGLAATTSETPEGKVDRVALVFQVALPQGADLPALRQALGGCASSMGMEGSLQHRDIFEAMHRISPL
ncbi:MAG: ACT domain-containing protein, partial [Desulfovibrionaceae bacterium]